MALDDLFTTLLRRCHDQPLTAELEEEAQGIRSLPMKTAYRYKA